MSTLDMEYWTYDDGSIGASIEGVDGNIWAKDEATLVRAMKWLYDQITRIEKEGQQTGSSQRKADLGIQGSWIDKEFVIRLLAIPGFGVSFTSREKLQKWLSHLIVSMVQPQQPQEEIIVAISQDHKRHQIKTHD